MLITLTAVSLLAQMRPFDYKGDTKRVPGEIVLTLKAGQYEISKARYLILSQTHSGEIIKMKGFDTPSLPYELRNFTVAGWGVTFRYDFSRDKGQVVTIARANPGQTKILLTKGEIQEGFGFDKISCSLGVRIKVRDTLKLFRHAADYGGHLVMAYGDYIEPMKDLSEMMNFDLFVV